ncbi:hypothetical protein [Winogradskyella flava]|uniref:hypothetical protein n=1 Tax=Winogradskyella flava TaxID=1884876 RepID=UPI002490BE77|nr:hypothetical protein [Winogradskyella flava]
MKGHLVKLIFLVFAINLSTAQEWMTDLKIAQKLALVQNKMVLMVWEGTTEYPYPVFVNNEKGRKIYVDNLFLDENLSPLIWEYFVPVIVSENKYGVYYSEIKGKRSRNYIEKFNDNSIKIMDVNGNILNTSDIYLEDLENISTIIKKYALDTEFLAPELRGYQTQKDFYSAYYLASKYMDFSLYGKEKLRPDLLKLAKIYIDEARSFAKAESKEEQSVLAQRCNLLEINQYLLLKRPKKVLRLLEKMDAYKIDNANTSFIAYLYYTAYMSSKRLEDAESWKSKISSVNLKKAQVIINLNS